MKPFIRYIILCCCFLCLGIIVIAQEASPESICIGTTKHYYVDPNPIAGSTYRWRIDGIVQTRSHVNEIDIPWLNTGTFVLDVQEQSLKGCFGQLKGETITVNPIPSIMLSSNSPVNESSTIILRSESITADHYFWTGPNGYTSSDQNTEILLATLSDAGVYSCYSSNNGCNSIPLSILIAVKNSVIVDFNIPEGFSPNGDGINDFFVIRGIDRYPNNNFQCFNRWGVKIYEANNYQNTWDGTLVKGLHIGTDQLPVGTYFYILELGDGSSVYKGTIYLNR
jgi:gliding motility-associated-like protein